MTTGKESSTQRTPTERLIGQINQKLPNAELYPINACEILCVGLHAYRPYTIGYYVNTVLVDYAIKADVTIVYLG